MAPSPRGKAEVCKTFIPGSNPGGASKMPILGRFADLAHPVERHLAKVEVASSSLVIRSIIFKKHFSTLSFERCFLRTKKLGAFVPRGTKLKKCFNKAANSTFFVLF